MAASQCAQELFQTLLNRSMRGLAATDVDGLLVLGLVAERGSFSAAARELGLAPSAVSKRIAALEARLGARLCLRTTRIMTLSRAGLSLLPSATRVLEAWRSANGDVRAQSTSIRINAPGLFVERVLMKVLAAHAQSWPELVCSISCDDRMIELSNGSFDVVVRIAPRITQTSAVVRPIGRDRLVTVASPDYLARHGVPTVATELAGHRALRYAPREAVEEWRYVVDGQPVSVPIRPALVAGEDKVIRGAALEGLGLAVIPHMFVADEIVAGRLVSVLEGQLWRPQRTIHAVILEGRLAPPHVKRFVGTIAQASRA